jgi:hypothetical protein
MSHAFTWRAAGLAAVVAVFLGCSSNTGPFTRVANGTWSQSTSMNMTVTSTGATIQLPCEGDAIDQPLTVDASGNFSWTGTITSFGNIAGAGSRPASFTGHATPTEIIMTRSVTDGSPFTPQTNTLVRGSTSIAPCSA